MQAATIQTWRDAGFQPVSVNLSWEVAQYPQFEAFLELCGVELCLVESEGRVAGEPPLVPVVQLLEAARRRAGDSPFAIINADIDVAPSPGQPLARHVAALEADAYLLGQRTDWAPRDHDVQERVFPFGFDFMALHGSCIGRLEGLLSPALRLGRPWWDHYLPLASIAIGAHTVLVSPGWFRHTIHEARWSRRHYVQVGRAAAVHFRDALGHLGTPAGGRAWLDALNGTPTLPGIPVAWAGGVFRVGLHSLAPTVLAASLMSRLARAHMQIILQTAWTGPVPTGTAVSPVVGGAEVVR